VGQPAGPGWRAAADLFGAGLEPALAELAEARGAPHRAVAGAALVEQYAARLVPPFLAAVLVEGRAADPGMDRVRVTWSGGRVGMVALRGPVAPCEDRGAAAVAALMDTNLAVAVEAVHRAAGTSVRVLRGAVAHVATVTALHLSWPDDRPARYLEPVGRVLERWGVRDLVAMEAVHVAGEDWLYAERRTCCLAFRTADHRRRADPFCATCPVTPEGERRRSFLDAVEAFRERTGRVAVRRR
jgi:hypothetical protein